MWIEQCAPTAVGSHFGRRPRRDPGRPGRLRARRGPRGANGAASAHYAIQQLRAIGARIVGAVLNDPDQKIAGYGKYAYYYEYYADAAD